MSLNLLELIAYHFKAVHGFLTGRVSMLIGPIRRRASTRHFRGGLDSQISHPVRGLMEELEHSMPPHDVVTGTTTSAAAFLYKSSPGLPVSNANSRALLIARLTDWQRKQHEEQLMAGWDDWWQANTVARDKLEQLRRCPQVNQLPPFHYRFLSSKLMIITTCFF